MAQTEAGAFHSSPTRGTRSGGVRGCTVLFAGTKRHYFFSFLFAQAAACLSCLSASSIRFLALTAWPSKSNSLAAWAAEMLVKACSSALCANARLGWRLALTDCAGAAGCWARVIEMRRAPR